MVGKEELEDEGCQQTCSTSTDDSGVEEGSMGSVSRVCVLLEEILLITETLFNNFYLRCELIFTTSFLKVKDIRAMFRGGPDYKNFGKPLRPIQPTKPKVLNCLDILVIFDKHFKSYILLFSL